MAVDEVEVICEESISSDSDVLRRAKCSRRGSEVFMVVR